ncbi:MAG: DUF4984 domain-containing protein [Tidjanibacter sp.]|nr:DUF4984 domain-containing protein [Tidjanibacter sp.]
MKRLPIYIILAMLLWGTIACEEQYITLKDVNYVMFAEQEQYFLVEEDQEYFSVMISATETSKSDRTFGVEVIDKGSNSIEGYHYRLLSNSVTIPAGSRSGEVRVRGIYENIQATDSLGFTLKLIVPESMEWNDLYTDGTQSKIVMYKSCPFDINNFTGYALVSSMLLQNYPGENVGYQRAIVCDLHPTEEDTIIFRDCFYDGYDVRIKFHGNNPEEPLISMEAGQTISDEHSVLGWQPGDNHLLATTSPYYDSYFNSCQRYAVLWMQVYVENLGEAVGTLGHYYNVIEWISEEEYLEFSKELQ